MSYSINGTTIAVSGTVDLTNTSLGQISRIEFGAGGASAAFSSRTFMGIPGFGDSYTVVGSAAADVLTINIIDHGPPTPFGPPPMFEPPVNLCFFRFLNWGAGDTLVVNGNSDTNSFFSGAYQAATFHGGDGDDTYYIRPADIVDEAGSNGTDTIVSYESISLVDPRVRGDVENVTLTTYAGQFSYAIGNALANKLIGGPADNILDGGAGDDEMAGRGGNDIYVVDSTNDIVDESVPFSGGIDTVQSYFDYTLLDSVHVMGVVENLTLLGSAVRAEGNGYANILTGNGLDNVLAGLEGNDVLDGGTGADQLDGGAGHDTYVLGAEATGLDTIVDATGADTITSSIDRSLAFAGYSQIENLTLLGSAATGYGNVLSNVLTGNAKANRLIGLEGNDTLVGLRGGDRLTGGLGADKFVFTSVTDSRLSGGRDVIADFRHAQHDRIDVSTIDANTHLRGNQAFHFIGGSAFSHHAGELRSQRVGHGSRIEGDTNGDGVADLAIISALPAHFVRSDFVL